MSFNAPVPPTPRLRTSLRLLVSLPTPLFPPLAYTVPGPKVDYTPLLIVCENGHTEVALALIAKGANLEAATTVRPWGGVRVGGRADRQMSGMDGGVSQPPLAPPSLRRLRARANSYLLTYRSLTRTSLSSLPPSSPPLAYTVPGPQNGFTPLLKACEKGHTETALALVEKGANVDVADNVRP